jgi:DNA transposition AAA+ family ATPase
MGARADSIDLAKARPAPCYTKVRDAVNAYLSRADISHAELAEQINYGKSSIHTFMQGRYPAGDDSYIRAELWDFMERHPLESKTRAKAQLFETENFRHIQKYFRRATEFGEWVLLYGPPGTQKSFVLDHLICEQHREKRLRAVYVYASHEMRPLAMLKRIGREMGAPIRVSAKERLLNIVVNSFRQREDVPAIVIDEAQHLNVNCLETIRELHDIGGCGVVLAGSHMLYRGFMAPERKGHLEQLLSRIDHRDELPGLRESEVGEIAERELGKKLGEKFLKELVGSCLVDDIFAGTETRSYLSVRRLVKQLAQYKAKREVA